MNAGDTFLLAAEHADIDPHLWVILSDPVKDTARVLIVSITTLRPHKDQACIIRRGEHLWVTHDSCVAYEHARIVKLEQLRGLRNAGKLVTQDPVSAKLLTRMRSSAADSERLEMQYADLLIEQGLLDL
jgi:hypothetical protein